MGVLSRFQIKTICLILLVLFACAQLSFAATIENYRQRIEAAHLDGEALLDLTRENDLATRDVAEENERIAEIKRLVPPTEKIDDAGAVETSNQWLHSALDQFAKEPDAAKRRNIVIAALERLAAIAREADELEKAVAAARSKDEDKQKLAEILQRPEFQKPEAPEESLFQRWWRKFLEWLDREFPSTPNTPRVDSAGLGGLRLVLQILIWAAIIGLVGFIVYKFAPGLFGRFGARNKTKRTDRVILGERVAADESASDLFSEAEQLAREGNLRGAIRKGYVALLVELSDRKVIGLARHKTNRDYLRDVRKRADLLEGMTGMTRSFEQNWYGLKPAGEADWEDFRETYRRTITRV